MAAKVSCRYPPLDTLQPKLFSAGVVFVSVLFASPEYFMSLHTILQEFPMLTIDCELPHLLVRFAPEYLSHTLGRPSQADRWLGRHFYCYISCETAVACANTSSLPWRSSGL